MESMTNAAEAGSLTRATQVAKLLGISLTTVRRKEGKTLHPRQGAKGEHLFYAAEVEAERQRMLAEGHPEPGYMDNLAETDA